MRISLPTRGLPLQRSATHDQWSLTPLIMLLTGEIEAVFDPIVTTLAQLKTGRIGPLAVSSAKRATVLPDIPTVGEAGVPGFEATNWFGVFAPAGTSRTIVERLNAAINKAANSPEMKQTLHAQGADALMGTPDDLAELLRRELAKYRVIVRDAKASLK